MISKEERHGDLYAVTVTDTGVSHRINNKPNQDAALFSFEGENFVLAVSDGVGSCSNAELGAEKAVESAVTVFHNLEHGKIQTEEIPKRIIDEWKRLLNDTEVDECCATIKVAMKIGNQLVLISLGDGLLVMTSRGISVEAPLDDMPFANQTRCLSSFVQPTDMWFKEIHLDTHMPYAIFICTDGIANALRANSEVELVKEIEENTPSEKLKSELESLAVDISDFSSDDRTLGVIKYEWKNAKS